MELVNLLRNAFVESQLHRDPWGVASLSPDTQIELLVSSWLHIYCELPRLAVTWFGIKSHYLQQPWLMRVDVFVTYERDNSPRSQDVCYPPPLHPPPPKKEQKTEKEPHNDNWKIQSSQKCLRECRRSILYPLPLPLSDCSLCWHFVQQLVNHILLTHRRLSGESISIFKLAKLRAAFGLAGPPHFSLAATCARLISNLLWTHPNMKDIHYKKKLYLTELGFELKVQMFVNFLYTCNSSKSGKQ